MSIRGALASVIYGALLCGATFLIGLKGTLFLLGFFYIIQSILQYKNVGYYNKIKSLMNYDREKAYEKKSLEFKEYVKTDPISNIFIGALFIFLGFRFDWVAINLRFYIAIMIFVVSNYFIEVYSMNKSETWEVYRKNSIMLSMIVLVMVLFLLS